MKKRWGQEVIKRVCLRYVSLRHNGYTLAICKKTIISIFWIMCFFRLLQVNKDESAAILNYIRTTAETMNLVQISKANAVHIMQTTLFLFKHKEYVSIIWFCVHCGVVFTLDVHLVIRRSILDRFIDWSYYTKGWFR